MQSEIRQIAERIATSAPGGWTRAVVTGVAGRSGGVSVLGTYLVPGAPNGQVLMKPMIVMGMMPGFTRMLVRTNGWQQACLELWCEPTGTFTFTAASGPITHEIVGGQSCYVAILDGEYRLPRSGAAQQAGNSAPTGDPDLAVARFRTYLARRDAILGRPATLSPPATSTAIEETERRLGCQLPADLRALYLIADGEADDDGDLFNGYRWLPLNLLADYVEEFPSMWDYESTLDKALYWQWVVSTPIRRRRCGAAPIILRGCRSRPATASISWRSTKPQRSGAVLARSFPSVVISASPFGTRPIRSPRCSVST